MRTLLGTHKAIVGSFAVAGLFAVGGLVAGAQADVSSVPVAATASDADAPDRVPLERAPAPDLVETIPSLAPTTTTTTTPAPTTTAAPAPTTTAPPTTTPPTTAPAPAPAPAAPAAAPAPSTPPPTTAAPATSPSSGEEAAAVTPDADDPRLDADCEAQFVQLINGERSDAGVSPVASDERARRVARAWTLQMAEAHHLAHNPHYAEQLSAEGIVWTWAAENVAYDSDVVPAHEALMNSSGHRANVLAAQATGVGVGCARGTDGILWVTQVFWG